MIVLVDSCVSRDVAEQLRDSHDVDWVGDWSADPGDAEILRRAHNEERILITLDKDFGELATSLGAPHSGIIRLVDIRLSEQAARCDEALRSYSAVLLRGGIVTLERGRTRVRDPAAH